MEKKIIRMTENELHIIIKESVQKVLDEYGTAEQLGAIAARRKLRGNDSSEIHNYARNKGIKNSSYYKGYIEYMQTHPEEMIKYARDKFHNKR